MEANLRVDYVTLDGSELIMLLEEEPLIIDKGRHVELFV